MFEQPQRLVQHGFNNIEIEKVRLLDIIKGNKEKHVEEYKKSVKAYETAKLAYAQEFWAQLSENIGLAKKAMDEKLELVADAVLTARDKNAEEGTIDLKHINASIVYSLQPKVQLAVKQPVSHEKEYDVAIRGLELSTAEFVFLDQANFSCYVLDEWHWKSEFNSNNITLFSGASIANNAYFATNAISGCISVIGSGANIGSTSNPHGLTLGDIPVYGSGVSTLGVKSSQLFSSIYNNTGVK